MTDTARHQSLLDGCKTISENCLYTATTHYILAKQAGWRVALFLLVPAVVAAVAGILTSVGMPGWIGAFASAAGLVSGVATFLGADRKEIAHKSAGNLFTCLRHEARALHETFHLSLPDDQLLAEVRRLSDRYNCLVETTELTDDKAYEKARKKVKSGTFTPDFREGPKVETK
jgi:hypothetical protein